MDNIRWDVFRHIVVLINIYVTPNEIGSLLSALGEIALATATHFSGAWSVCRLSSVTLVHPA